MAKRLFADTDEVTERRMIEIARATPIWKKFRQAADSTAATKQLALVGLRRRYPRATEAELRQRLAAVLLDRETVIAMYGWDPLKEGY